MLRYVLALLIINSYSGSLGAPHNNSLSALLDALSKRCENHFVVAQIENQIQECNDSNHNMKRKFECLIFYDINNQLCTAISQSKINISEDYAEKVNKKHNVKNLCESAKRWTFSKLSDKYLTDVKLVFQNPMKCAAVCEVEDFSSDDSIFYCKYYNWGWEILNPQVTPTAQVNNVIKPVVGDTSATGLKLDETHLNNTDAQVKDITSSTKTSETKTELTPDKQNSIKTDEAVKDANTDYISHIPTVKTQALDDISHIPEKADQIEDIQVVADNKKSDEKSTKSIAENGKNVAEDKPEDVPISVSGDQVNNAVIPQPDVKKGESANDLLNQLEIPKGDVKPNDADDYQGNDLDSEEGKEGLPDTQGNDDGDDPVLSDLDLKPVQDENKNTPKRIQSAINSFSADISQREFYPNSIPEDFTEDDDHFFPFFLTAIILVVLLYVLYHNKNKVSKVVLGLIVEGRQPGRRRNSRGHAYRRLDTLEQAMSGNLAAPPSKIIY